MGTAAITIGRQFFLRPGNDSSYENVWVHRRGGHSPRHRFVTAPLGNNETWITGGGAPKTFCRYYTRPLTIPRNTGFGFQIAYYLDAATRSRHFGITLRDCNYSNYHNIFFNLSLSFNSYINTTSAYQTHDYNNIAYECSWWAFNYTSKIITCVISPLGRTGTKRLDYDREISRMVLLY